MHRELWEATGWTLLFIALVVFTTLGVFHAAVALVDAVRGVCGG